MKSSRFKFIFLGTGTSQGIPVIGSHHPVCLSSDFKDKRLRSSIYIILDSTHILIDCGPDFRQQMLRNHLHKLDAILFTHEHNDHVVGLDDVRPIFFEQQKNIELYGLERVLKDIQLRFPYSFDPKRIASVAGFNLNIIDEARSFTIKDFKFQPIQVLHDTLPILGYKWNRFAYLTDVSDIPESSISALMNLDVLVLNTLRKHPKHVGHLTLNESLEWIRRLQPKRAYLTHVSHTLGFHEEVQKELPPHVFLAYDGLEVIIS